jgi:hypothetical protein
MHFSVSHLWAPQQILATIAVGGALSALLPHPFARSRGLVAAEGAVVALLFWVLFNAGSGRALEDPLGPLAVAIAAAGLLLYLALVRVFWRYLGRPAGGAQDFTGT